MSGGRSERVILGCFALLDLIGLWVVPTQIQSLRQTFSLGSSPLLFELINSVLAMSLAFSAYGLIRVRPWAFTLSYIQFPFRLLGAHLSLGFLGALLQHFGLREFSSVALIIAVTCEWLRLFITRKIQKRIQS